MKRHLFTALAVVVTSLVGGPAVAQTTFKIATVAPEGSHWMVSIREGAAEIDTRTQGRVKFKFYTGAIQGTDAQVRRKMRIGQLHGGAFTSGAMKYFQQDSEFYGLPLMFNDDAEVKFVRERMDDRLRARMEDAGYVNFGFAGGGFAYLMANHPIARLQDMKGSKIWIPEGDDVARSATEALGISPVTLPLTDVLTGLQTELVDTILGPPVGAIVMQWHTAVSTITTAPIVYTFGMLLIDAKVFARLSADDQAVVREVMERIYRGFDEQSATDNADGMQALLEDGLQPVAVADAELAEWRRLIHASNRKAGERGVFDLALLDEADCYLAAFRSGTNGSNCGP